MAMMAPSRTTAALGVPAFGQRQGEMQWRGRSEAGDLLPEPPRHLVGVEPEIRRIGANEADRIDRTWQGLKSVDLDRLQEAAADVQRQARFGEIKAGLQTATPQQRADPPLRLRLDLARHD